MPSAIAAPSTRCGAPGPVERHRRGAVLQPHRPEQAGDAEHVVGVIVGEEDLAKGEAHAVAHHLALVALAAVEEDASPLRAARPARRRCGRRWGGGAGAEEGDAQHAGSKRERRRRETYGVVDRLRSLRLARHVLRTSSPSPASSPDASAARPAASSWTGTPPACRSRARCRWRTCRWCPGPRFIPASSVSSRAPVIVSCAVMAARLPVSVSARLSVRASAGLASVLSSRLLSRRNDGHGPGELRRRALVRVAVASAWCAAPP